MVQHVASADEARGWAEMHIEAIEVAVSTICTSRARNRAKSKAYSRRDCSYGIYES